MKTPLILVLGFLFAASAHAEFRTWARNDGKTAEMELISVAESSAEATGEFKMRDGRTVRVEASSLSEEDAKILKDWKPAASTEAATPSALDKMLEGNLLKLSGKSLRACKDATKPTKYYLFYYTASWCGPCHKFTPSLVDFYKKNKSGNDEFELVLITSDSSEDAMEEYAAQFKMPWPQLKLARVEKFKNEFKHPGTGIPNLVLTDTEGRLIKGSYEGGTYVGPTVVMNHLKSLLKSK